MMEYDDQTYYVLMLKSLEQEITEQERNVLTAWLAASPSNRRQFEQVERVWEATAPSPRRSEPNHEEAWRVVVERTGLPDSGDRAPVRRIGRSSLWRYRWLVVPAVILFASAIWMLMPRSPRMVEVAAGTAGSRTVYLPDSSLVRLNPGAHLRFQEAFSGATRAVILEGDAFFTVKKGDRSFVVVHQAVEVEVLGTQFSVRVRERQTRVVVQEGRVRVQSRKAPDVQVELLAGEGAAWVEDARFAALDSTAVRDGLDWIGGVVLFEQTAFTDAAEKLARVFGKAIDVSDPALGQQFVSGSIELVDGVQALNTLCLTLSTPCTVVSAGDTLVVE